jgi:hypothetical protein
MSIGTYSFLPYLREGLANSLQSTGEARGTFTVDMNVVGDAITAPVDQQKVEIYGPGDVVGIDPRSIVKTDPHGWITNFEPNYLAFIDFYSEDFPWRYTPTPPSGKRLNTWISLVVLEEGEFTEGQNSLDRPLPTFKLKGPAIRDLFPKVNQLWAWAHVHFNGDLTAADATIMIDGAGPVNAALDKLQGALNVNPDTAYSRLLCPRKLRPSAAYHAFVIPSYESGRLAGLGRSAAEIAAAQLKIAWETPANLEFPYYYRWQFNTGKEGDFEYLVRLLKPKVADSRVGRRVMDMTDPRGNLVWVEDPAPEHRLGGILRLGGALQVPDESLTDKEIEKKEKFDKWASRSFPHPFQVQLAALLNLADDYNIATSSAANISAEQKGLDLDPNEDSDPLITPPIYGKWHAMVERVYVDRNANRIDNNYNWLNELNLDPRYRVPAHFGTRVVQENQENYMEAAWEQVGDVLKANKQIRYGQFGIAASTALYEKHFIAANKAAASKTLLLTAPLQKRVLASRDQVTVFHLMRQSVIPNTVLSAPMRRIVRPRGRLAHHLEKRLPAGEKIRLETIVTQINQGRILPAPPKTIPPALPAVDTVVGSIEPTIPRFLKDLLLRYSWLPFLALVLAVLIALLSFLFAATTAVLIAGLVIAAALVFVWRLLTGWAKDLRLANSIKSANVGPELVDEMPMSSNFILTDFDDGFTPAIGGTTDSAEAGRFKNSLRDLHRLLRISRESIPPARKPVVPDIRLVANDILGQLRPEKTIPAWVWDRIIIPPRIKDELFDEGFVEAMNYPKINKPMYEDLKKISDELFLPNVELIERNSMTLLETNQKFIESYMVGLNHEFARELLWREYPTDQRGSYFRQFWDTSSVLKDPALKNKSEDEQREPYYDIPKLHLWRRASKLGDHDHRQPPNEPPRNELVLVVRGELLKKYPRTVVYAHKANWTKNPDTGQPDKNLIRSLHQEAEGDKAKPDPAIVLTPTYQAKIDPDIYFFGFDLTVEEARGQNNPETPTLSNAGWFFVIKERPGEPRFGLDVPAPDGGSNKLVSWNDLDWSRVLPGDGVIDVLNLPAAVKLPDTPPASDGGTEQEGQKIQYLDDKNITWGSDIDAANLAYVLYQVPMMVCTHAADMLLQKD